MNFLLDIAWKLAALSGMRLISSGAIEKQSSLKCEMKPKRNKNYQYMY